MSRIYEALMQKEQETSAALHGHTREELKTNAGPDSDKQQMGVADQLLQAAVVAGEQRQLSADALLTPPAAGSGTPAPRPTISPEKFPRLKLGHREESRLIFQTDPDGLAAEQFRFLRRTLEQKFPTGAVLLITSPAPRDGKTLTALNLCACFADSGRSTLLLEADIRQPGVHKLLGRTNSSPGIEDALAGTVEPAQVVRFVEELSLYVAIVAEPPADPFRLVSGAGAERLLGWARDNFDWIVIDSPPILPAADVTALTSLADAVLLVVRAQSTPRELAIRAFELLGDHLYGVVLNEATIDSNPYYRYLAEYRHSGHNIPPS